MNSWLFIALPVNGDASQKDSALFCSTNGETPYSVERTAVIAKAVATTGVGVGHFTYMASAAQTTVNLAVAK
ncbi:hypothetical protein SC171_17690 [Pantoea cypripedii]|uniref:hypothetical protein n=1 Tax=Pantoea cypripedii TaxID=55209 RepID=UPI002FC8280B